MSAQVDVHNCSYNLCTGYCALSVRDKIEIKAMKGKLSKTAK